MTLLSLKVCSSSQKRSGGEKKLGIWGFQLTTLLSDNWCTNSFHMVLCQTLLLSLAGIRFCNAISSPLALQHLVKILPPLTYNPLSWNYPAFFLCLIQYVELEAGLLFVCRGPSSLTEGSELLQAAWISVRYTKIRKQKLGYGICKSIVVPWWPSFVRPRFNEVIIIITYDFHVFKTDMWRHSLF